MKTIWDIQKSLGLKEDTRHPEMKRYEGTFSTGEFDGMYDYGAGILGVVIGLTYATMEEVKAKQGLVFLNVYTIDDGGWQASTVKSVPQEEANKIVEQIVEAWEWETKLPTAKELNEFLQKFAMWGEYTG